MTTQITPYLCSHCFADLDYDSSHAGDTVKCPACGNLTRLGAPKIPPLPNPPRLPNASEVRTMSEMTRWILFVVKGLLVGFGFFVVVALAIGAFEALERTGDPQAKAFAGLIFFLLSLVGLFVLILWVVFPVFVYFGIRSMEKLLTQIEKNTRR